MAIAGAASLSIIALAWTSPLGQLYEANIRSRFNPPALSRELSLGTPRSAGIIVVGCDWDPTVLFYAKRRGLMLRADRGDADIFVDDAGPNDDLPKVSAGAIPRPFSYVAFCSSDRGTAFLPPTVKAVPISPHLWHLVPRGGA
jgi:hypothetical protein